MYHFGWYSRRLTVTLAFRLPKSVISCVSSGVLNHTNRSIFVIQRNMPDTLQDVLYSVLVRLCRFLTRGKGNAPKSNPLRKAGVYHGDQALEASINQSFAADSLLARQVGGISASRYIVTSPALRVSLTLPKRSRCNREPEKCIAHCRRLHSTKTFDFFTKRSNCAARSD